MPRFSDLDPAWTCPYHRGCPHLEGLSTTWVWARYQEAAGLECRYEYVIEQLEQELDAERQHSRSVETENQQLKAELQALHRRQFKGRRKPRNDDDDNNDDAAPKKRGAPVGHRPWKRRKPKRMDVVVAVPAPIDCPHCHCGRLVPLAQTKDHVQEDIVLQPRTVVTCFRHHLAACPECGRTLSQPGPGELTRRLYRPGRQGRVGLLAPRVERVQPQDQPLFRRLLRPKVCARQRLRL